MSHVQKVLRNLIFTQTSKVMHTCGNPRSPRNKLTACPTNQSCGTEPKFRLRSHHLNAFGSASSSNHPKLRGLWLHSPGSPPSALSAQNALPAILANVGDLAPMALSHTKPDQRENKQRLKCWPTRQRRVGRPALWINWQQNETAPQTPQTLTLNRTPHNSNK